MTVGFTLPVGLQCSNGQLGSFVWQDAWKKYWMEFVWRWKAQCPATALRASEPLKSRRWISEWISESRAKVYIIRRVDIGSWGGINALIAGVDVLAKQLAVQLAVAVMNLMNRFGYLRRCQAMPCYAHGMPLVLLSCIYGRIAANILVAT